MEYLLFSETFIIVIAIIFGILQIILFFKIWGMCNDISRIADKYAPKKTASERVEEVEEIVEMAKVGKKTPETREEMEAWLSGNNEQ